MKLAKREKIDILKDTTPDGRNFADMVLLHLKFEASNEKIEYDLIIKALLGIYNTL